MGKRFIDTISNHKFEKGVILTPDKMKLLQQLSIFMILSDEYQKLDFFSLNVNNINDQNLRSKVETFETSNEVKFIKKIIEEKNLKLSFTIASLMFLVGLANEEKELVIYLNYIHQKSKINNIKEINYYNIINSFFPVSTFKKEELEYYWELQKSETGEDLIYSDLLW